MGAEVTVAGTNLHKKIGIEDEDLILLLFLLLLLLLK